MRGEVLVALVVVTGSLLALGRGRPVRPAREPAVDGPDVSARSSSLGLRLRLGLSLGGSPAVDASAASGNLPVRYPSEEAGGLPVRYPSEGSGRLLVPHPSYGSGRPPARHRSRRLRGRRQHAIDLVGTLHDTAARLRSGAPPATAWSGALGRPAVRDVPTVHDLLGPGTPRREDVARATAVVAAARLAADLGAPLADVLEGVAAAVAADEEHGADVAAALAGPRATARVLLVLPVAGVLLGALLGADPVGVVTGGGVGTWSAVLGVILLLVGRWWTARLLARTAGAGRTPA